MTWFAAAITGALPDREVPMDTATRWTLLLYFLSYFRDERNAEPVFVD